MGDFSYTCPPGAECKDIMSCTNCVGPTRNTEAGPFRPSVEIREIGGGWYWVKGRKVQGRKKAEAVANDRS